MSYNVYNVDYAFVFHIHRFISAGLSSKKVFVLVIQCIGKFVCHKRHALPITVDEINNTHTVFDKSYDHVINYRYYIFS